MKTTHALGNEQISMLRSELRVRDRTVQWCSRPCTPNFGKRSRSSLPRPAHRTDESLTSDRSADETVVLGPSRFLFLLAPAGRTFCERHVHEVSDCHQHTLMHCCRFAYSRNQVLLLMPNKNCSSRSLCMRQRFGNTRPCSYINALCWDGLSARRHWRHPWL